MWLSIYQSICCRLYLWLWSYSNWKNDIAVTSGQNVFALHGGWLTLDMLHIRLLVQLEKRIDRVDIKLIILKLIQNPFNQLIPMCVFLLQIYYFWYLVICRINMYGVGICSYGGQKPKPRAIAIAVGTRTIHNLFNLCTVCVFLCFKSKT